MALSANWILSSMMKMISNIQYLLFLLFFQGMGMIVGTFLLIMEEEDSFWMMASVVEELLPASYYSPSLVGAQADQLVLRGLIASTLPALDALITEHDIEISLITLNWFLTLYSSVLHIKVLMRLWDLLLFEGSKVLFQVNIPLICIKCFFITIFFSNKGCPWNVKTP